MEHQEQIIVHGPDDALAQSMKIANDFANDGSERRIYRAKKEWARKPDRLEPLVKDSRA
jgi:hypothetical protein